MYLGRLFSPQIVFFGLTGFLQKLELHEGADTPTWIEQIASLHKHQALRVGEPKKSRPSAANSVPKPPNLEAETKRGPSPWPLKWFAVFMSIGLIFTTALGITISFKYQRNKALVWALLIVGAFLTFVLLWL